MLGGLALLALGGLIFANSLDSNIDWNTGQTSANGGEGFIGVALMVIGQLFAFIGVIAQGVKIGNQSS